jgi:hypothetical protein
MNNEAQNAIGDAIESNVFHGSEKSPFRFIFKFSGFNSSTWC